MQQWTLKPSMHCAAEHTEHLHLHKWRSVIQTSRITGAHLEWRNISQPEHPLQSIWSERKEETKEHLKYTKYRFQRIALGVNLESETESLQRQFIAQIMEGSQNQSDHRSQQNTSNTVMSRTKKTQSSENYHWCNRLEVHCSQDPYWETFFLSVMNPAL